jgi:hypothetical protein
MELQDMEQEVCTINPNLFLQDVSSANKLT